MVHARVRGAKIAQWGGAGWQRGRQADAGRRKPGIVMAVPTKANVGDVDAMLGLKRAHVSQQGCVCAVSAVHNAWGAADFTRREASA